MTELLRRRRALMAVGGGNPTANELVVGTYDSIVVASGNAVTRNEQASSSNYKVIPFMNPVLIESGDIIKLTFSNNGTAFDRIYTVEAGGGGKQALVNFVKISANTEYTVTSSASYTCSGLMWQLQPVSTPYTYIVHMTINGKVVL